MLKSPLELCSRKNRPTVLVSLLLAALTLAVFWPVIHFDFVNYDDPGYVTENSHVSRGLTWEDVVWAFRTGHAANWHPVTWLSHMLDCQLYGLKPWGHHLTNLLFHTANTLLLFLLLQRMTGARWRSAFVAALFALHPLHVESVAWVAERKDVLSTFFGLLSIWAYAAYVEKSKVQSPKSKVMGASATQPATRNTLPAPRFYLLSLLLFALSLMSKPMHVTLPFLLLLLDYWPLRRLDPPSANARVQGSRFKVQGSEVLRLFVEKLPFLALAATSSIVTFLTQKHGGALAPADLLPMGSRILNTVVAYATYTGKLLWPIHLSVFYPYPQVRSPGLIALAAVFLLAITASAMLGCRKAPHFLVGWLWFLGTLVPVIGLVQVGSQSMADRYSYIPSIGLFLALAWLAAEAATRWRFGPRLLGVAGALAIVLCLSCTRTQLSYWKNGETLFRHALAVTTGNFVAHSNLGNALATRGKPREAEAQFSSALKIYPDYYPAMYALANLVRTNGDSAAALTLFNRALQTRPHDAKAHYNHGVVLVVLGKEDAALDEYRQALQLDPKLAPAHNNLAGLLISRGKAEEGLAHALTALRLQPDFAQAHLNAGNALFLQEKFPEAEGHYWIALKLEPGLSDAQLDLAKTLVNQDRLAEAEIHLKEAVRLQPTAAEAHQVLATIYAAQKRPKDAVREYAAALRLDPEWAEGLNRLAWILATHPDQKIRNGIEAVRLAGRACALTGSTNEPMLETLAAAYAEAGRFADAVAIQQNACDWAGSQGQPAGVESAEHRLELYRSGQPFREP